MSANDASFKGLIILQASLRRNICCALSGVESRVVRGRGGGGGGIDSEEGNLFLSFSLESFLVPC